MCDAAWGWQGGLVELPEVGDDSSNGCKYDNAACREASPSRPSSFFISTTKKGGSSGLMASGFIPNRVRETSQFNGKAKIRRGYL